MTRPAPVPVPRTLTVVSAAVVIAGLVMIFAGGWRTGISWDEPYHIVRMRTFLEQGWYLFPRDLDNGEPGAWFSQVYVYSPATMGFLHVLAAGLGVEAWNEIPASSQAYAIRHIGIGLIAVVGLAAVAATGRIVLRSWSWGVVTAAVLVSIPMWTGHAMFNLKDIPVATGYSLVTLGCIIAARRKATDAPRWLGPLVLVAGIVIGVGTRPGLWPGLAASMGVLVLFTVLRESTDGWGRAVRVNLWRYVELLAALVVSQVILVLIYPNTFLRPQSALLESALSSAGYNDKSSPWWYIPGHLLVGMPTLLLILGLIGTGFALRRVFATGFRPDYQATILTLVGLQVYLMPGLAMIRESNLYNALRQLLFSAPAMAVLIAFGMSVLLSALQGRAGRVKAVLVLACVAMLLPMIAQARLFPYNYTFASAPSEASSYNHRTDYWRTSVRELAPAIPTGGLVICSPTLDAKGRSLTRSHDGTEDCVTNLIGPLLPYADQRKRTAPLSPTQFYAVTFGGKPMGSNCTELARVERPRLFSSQLMSRVARCELVLDPYSGPVRFKNAGVPRNHIMSGWYGYPKVSGITAVGADSGLGFELDEKLRNRQLSISIGTAGAEQLPLRANGVEVETRRTSDGFVAKVPKDVASAYGEGRLVLSFTGDGELRVLGVEFAGEGAAR